jgi:hypothetical protein
VYGGETVVSRPRLVVAIHFKMIEKLPQQNDVEIFDPYFTWPSF